MQLERALTFIASLRLQYSALDALECLDPGLLCLLVGLSLPSLLFISLLLLHSRTERGILEQFLLLREQHEVLLLLEVRRCSYFFFLLRANGFVSAVESDR